MGTSPQTRRLHNHTHTRTQTVCLPQGHYYDAMIKLPFELLSQHIINASNFLPSGPEAGADKDAGPATKGAHPMDDIDYDVIYRALQDRSDQEIVM